jgi:hypothetical protein
VYTILTLVTKSYDMSIPCEQTDGHGMCITRNDSTLREGHMCGNGKDTVHPTIGLEGTEGE